MTITFDLMHYMIFYVFLSFMDQSELDYIKRSGWLDFVGTLSTCAYKNFEQERSNGVETRFSTSATTALQLYY